MDHDQVGTVVQEQRADVLIGDFSVVGGIEISGCEYLMGRKAELVASVSAGRMNLTNTRSIMKAFVLQSQTLCYGRIGFCDTLA